MTTASKTAQGVPDMVQVTEGSGGVAGWKIVASIAGTVALGMVVAALIWWWRLTPQEQAEVWQSTQATLLWLVFMLVLPWGLFFVPALVVKAESNLASAAMLVGYLIVDLLALLWLWDWSVSSASGWVLLLIFMGLATAYNYIICESIARLAARR